jgi:UDP:flavonoid glycosyltransferase YjiC (YdhE family)
MKFVLPCYGVRGDVEPSVVVGRELLRRGHDVQMAVPPNLVGFAEAAGLAATAYGLDSRIIMEAQRDYWTCFFRNPWRLRDLDRLGREISEIVTRCWTREVTTTLASLADGSITTFPWPCCIGSRCGPTATSCHCCQRGWVAQQ